MILLLLLLLAIGTFFIYSHTQAETIEDRMEILEETTAMLEHEHIRDLEKQIEEDPSLEEDHEVQEQLAFLQQQLKEEETELLALRSEEHTSELQSRGHLVCRLLLEKKNKRRY